MTSSTTHTPGPNRDDDQLGVRSLRVRGWVYLLIAAGVLVAFRSHAFTIPLETDECNYAYIAGRLIDGDRLYVDVWDHQPPGVFAMFAVAIELFGSSPTMVRCLAMGASLVAMVLLFVMLLRTSGPTAAALGALIFAICSSDPGIAGEGSNREIFMNTLALAALLPLTGRTLTTRRLLLVGLALGLGSTLKTVMAAQWLLVLIWVIARRWVLSRSLKDTVLAAVWMSVGPLVIWLGIFAYFAAVGRFAEFSDAVFGFNLGYSGIGEGFFDRYPRFFGGPMRVFTSALPLWIAAACTTPILVVLSRRELAGHTGLVLAFAMGSFQAVCLPGRYWPHYYGLLLPPMVLVCVLVISKVAAQFRSRAATVSLATLTGVWLAGLLWYQYQYYLGVDPMQVTAHRYDYRAQWGRAQGVRVGQLTDPSDTVFVWGKDAGIYFYSHRRSASRYTMVGSLEDGVRGARERRRILLEELRSARPRLVLVVEPEFDELRSYLEKNYVIAGVDMHDLHPNRPIMLALMDKNRPVELVDWEWRAPGR